MKTNTKKPEGTVGFTTHGGAQAAKESPEKELVRTVSSLLLFENTHYEKGSDIAERVKNLVKKVSMQFVCDLAKRARTDLKLRHAPLYLLVCALDKSGTPEERNLLGHTIADVIQRADELAEIIAIYWKDGKKPLPRQLKAGVAKAFRKFGEYELAKYNRDGAVKLRDALFLSHPSPESKSQLKLWKKLIDKKLETPDTWEVELSAGKDKKATFTRLLKQEKLGYMALLRNLRNMVESGVDKGLIEDALVEGAAKSRALPFRFIAAAKHAPKLEEALGKAMVTASEKLARLPGRTLLVIDVSGSMQHNLGGKSEMGRIDAASGLAILIREQSSDLTIYATAGNDSARIHKTELVPSRRAFALSDAIKDKYDSLGGGGIFMVQTMNYIAKHESKKFDRVIVITDEQDCDAPHVKASAAQKLGLENYIINIGVYEPALPVTGAGWTRISGFSERVIDWIMANEQESKN